VVIYLLWFKLWMWNGIKHNFILLNHCKPTTFELHLHLTMAESIFVWAFVKWDNCWALSRKGVSSSALSGCCLWLGFQTLAVNELCVVAFQLVVGWQVDIYLLKVELSGVALAFILLDDVEWDKA
jgi:hypothetical protein